MAKHMLLLRSVLVRSAIVRTFKANAGDAKQIINANNDKEINDPAFTSLLDNTREKLTNFFSDNLNWLVLLKEDVKKVKLVYIDKTGKKSNVEAAVGKTLLQIGQDNGLPIEGACESSLSCSTCHVYVDPKFLHLMPEPARGEEDMLDMAPFLQDTSRLGCQIKVTEEMEGMVVQLPPATRNFYVDGKVPEPH